MILIKNIVLVIIIHICLNKVSPFVSKYYDVPSYYGHFSLEYFNIHNITTDKLVLLEYNFAVSASYDNQTIFYAN